MHSVECPWHSKQGWGYRQRVNDLRGFFSGEKVLEDHASAIHRHAQRLQWYKRRPPPARTRTHTREQRIRKPATHYLWDSNENSNNNNDDDDRACVRACVSCMDGLQASNKPCLCR